MEELLIIVPNDLDQYPQKVDLIHNYCYSIDNETFAPVIEIVDKDDKTLFKWKVSAIFYRSMDIPHFNKFIQIYIRDNTLNKILK